MDTDLQLPRIQHTDSQTTLIACSLCLRVLHGSEWIDAEHVIREIRSYELEAPPRLEPAVCDFCADSILSRRAHVGEPLAA
jgi:hypothetical protein